MKKIALLTILILVISGCTQSSPTEENVDVENEKPANADTILDDTLYKEAVASNQQERCGLIKDEEVKQECIKVLEALLITREAAKNKDTSKCESIDLKRYKEKCLFDVEKGVEAEEKALEEQLDSQKALEEYEKASSLASEAFEKNDASLCEKIQQNSVKASCQANFYMGQASIENDASICEKISDENLVELCKMNLKAN